ncbi:MAG: hypothetical protein ACI9UT_001149 [Flavobacteriales bacterium]|jgi:hypothetical protein
MQRYLGDQTRIPREYAFGRQILFSDFFKCVLFDSPIDVFGNKRHMLTPNVT